MATRFERQLEQLHVEMITMGSLCEKVITLSARSILGYREELAHRPGNRQKRAGNRKSLHESSSSPAAGGR